MFKKLFFILSIVFSPTVLACRINEIQFAISSINSFVHHNPSAADTVSGVHNYWITWPDPVPAVNCTFVALAHLETEGLLERIRLEDGREIWRRKRLF